VAHPTIEHAGSTPDGFIGADGLVEFKVPMPVTYTRWRMAGEIPDEHVPQLLFQLACTRRQWVDFVAYCPEATDERLRLFIRRFEPKPEQIEEIEAKAVAFLVEVEAAFQHMTESA
jgi:exodeoxyribonuclease (lambda-induced)